MEVEFGILPGVEIGKSPLKNKKKAFSEEKALPVTNQKMPDQLFFRYWTS